MTASVVFNEDLLSWLYDQRMEDWPDEWEFWLDLANELVGENRNILEIGCGTGRVAIRLAQCGYSVTGLDKNRAMLDRARHKSNGLKTIDWVQADMRSFELDKKFALAIIPGHSFQHMLSADSQLECLYSIKSHLQANAKLVVHVNHDDLDWLADLPSEVGSQFNPAGDNKLPGSNHILRQSRAWSYVRATQTATAVNLREEVDADGTVINRWRSEPMPFHCFFPTEIEHLAARADLIIEVIYGDFKRQKFEEDSPQIIVVFRNQ